MTTFSIVVPVYNVRAYLRECLDSVLGQSCSDFELIAVDDHSPDGSGEILDEYAIADPRVSVLHLPENVGLGLAREAGMEAATGDYLLFLDSDDSLAVDALRSIADRLEATGRPDVLLYDYARTYWWGGVVRNQLGELFSVPGPDVFSIEDRPDLLNLLMVVWNKAYRREFILANGFRFPPGYYEDTPWTYPTLLSAQSIAVLDEVCVLYRQRRQGNILRSRSNKHFDIFDQYDRVFSFLDSRPELGGWAPFLFSRMLNHLFTIVVSPLRLPADRQEEFFHRAHEHYHRHRPPGYALPVNLTGLKYSLIERDDYRAFVLLRGLGQTGRQLKSSAKVRSRVTRRLRNGKRQALLAHYRTQLRRPLDPGLAVYSAYWSRGYACNPRDIYERAKELAPDVHGVWVVRPEVVSSLPPGVDYVLPLTKRYYEVMARATYLVNNVNYPDEIVKRDGSLHVQTQHGTPLKKMGLDLQDYPVGANRMSFRKLLERCDRWDFNISSNRFSTEVWERCFPAAYESLETGYPRNDRLITATPDDVAAARAGLGIEPERRVVLYCPTFRDWQRGFEPLLDLTRFCQSLGAGYTVLVRAHYFHGENTQLRELEASGRLVDVSAHPTVETLYLAADVLLTDYSSVMFDYANLDRPIVIYAHDWDTYVRCRGVNFDLLAEPPGAVATSEEDLVEVFTSGAAWGEEATKARAEFRRRFCGWDDGHAAERVVRRVFLGEQVHPPQPALAREPEPTAP